MITTGELPCDDLAGLWAAQGHGKRCAACAEPIGAREVDLYRACSRPMVLSNDSDRVNRWLKVPFADHASRSASALSAKTG